MKAAATLNRIAVSTALVLAAVAPPLRAQSADAGPLPVTVEDTLTGRFIAGYVQPSDPTLVRIYAWAKAGHSAEAVAKYLNATIKLPFDIRLQFQECHAANAFYLPDQHAVVFCYEYLAHFQQLFTTMRQSDSVTAALISGKMYFTFYHEVGHALVAALGIRIFGAEESAVDGFATYLLTSAEADAPAEAAVSYFNLQSKQYDGRRLNEIQGLLADEHALDKTRSVQIACWLYGEDSSRYRLWVRPDILPKARAQRCAHEFEQLKAFWDGSLAPYLKSAAVDSAQ